GRVWQAVLASVTPRDPEDPASPTGAEASSAESVLANQQRQQAARRLLAGLKIKPRKGLDGTDTKLVDIIVEGDSPHQAVHQVNAVAAVYVQQNLAQRLEASRKATTRLRVTDCNRNGSGLQSTKFETRLSASIHPFRTGLFAT